MKKYSAQELLDKARSHGIKVKNAYDAATRLAIRRAKSLPDCFGILFQEDKLCGKCRVNGYCGYVTRIGSPTSTFVAEDDLDDAQRSGLKDGSRSARFISRWGKKFLNSGELKQLSRNIFKEFKTDKGSVIDISRILNILRKRGLLIKKGKLYGIQQ